MFRSAMPNLHSMLNKIIKVSLKSKKEVIGILKGFDAHMNLVLLSQKEIDNTNGENKSKNSYDINGSSENKDSDSTKGSAEIMVDRDLNDKIGNKIIFKNDLIIRGDSIANILVFKD